MPALAFPQQQFYFDLSWGEQWRRMATLFCDVTTNGDLHFKSVTLPYSRFAQRLHNQKIMYIVDYIDM